MGKKSRDYIQIKVCELFSGEYILLVKDTARRNCHIVEYKSLRRVLLLASSTLTFKYIEINN